MADRDHRQWLEDEEERRRAREGKKSRIPKLTHRARPTASPIPDDERIAEIERKRLEDWQQDPIA